MEFFINETGQYEELHCFTETGMDCVQDIIGNSGAIGKEIRYDGDNDAYCINQADFDWWCEYLELHQCDEEELSSLCSLYGTEAVWDIMMHYNSGHIDYDQEHEHLQNVFSAIRDEFGEL